VPRGTDVNEGPAFKSPIRDRRILHLPWVACQEVFAGGTSAKNLTQEVLEVCKNPRFGIFF
jgi:hypothetical protein